MSEAVRATAFASIENAVLTVGLLVRTLGCCRFTKMGLSRCRVWVLRVLSLSGCSIFPSASIRSAVVSAALKFSFFQQHRFTMMGSLNTRLRSRFESYLFQMMHEFSQRFDLNGRAECGISSYVKVQLS